MPQASSQPGGRTDPTSTMARPTRGARIDGTSPTTAGTANPVRPRTRAASQVPYTVPASRPPFYGLPLPLFGGGPSCPWPGLLPASGGGSPPCPRPWPSDGGCFSCPLPPVPSGRDFRHSPVTVSGSPAASTGAWDVTPFSFFLLSAPLPTLEAWHGSSLTAPGPTVASGTPAGPPPWPSLVAPTAAPSPVLGTGCRPGVVAGIGAVSSTVAKMRLAVSRMGSGSVPVAAAAMPVVDRPHTATATSSPTRRRRPGLPVARGMARRARVTARSSASAASWPASSAGLGAATVAASSAATSAYPAGAWSGGRSPSRNRSTRSSSSASGSGSGANGSRLISADQVSSAAMGYTALRARGLWSAPSRSASRRSPRWVRTRTVFGRLSMSSATCLTSSPATTRSTMASA
jgi:hypothetical protein